MIERFSLKDRPEKSNIEVALQAAALCPDTEIPKIHPDTNPRVYGATADRYRWGVGAEVWVQGLQGAIDVSLAIDSVKTSGSEGIHEV